MKEIKKIFCFEESLANVAAYEALGFDVTVDDAINGVFYVEVDLTDYDWLNALAILEDCKRNNLQPFLQHNGAYIDWQDAYNYADLKACEELSNMEEKN